MLSFFRRQLLSLHQLQAILVGSLQLQPLLVELRLQLIRSHVGLGQLLLKAPSALFQALLVSDESIHKTSFLVQDLLLTSVARFLLGLKLQILGLKFTGALLLLLELGLQALSDSSFLHVRRDHLLHDGLLDISRGHALGGLRLGSRFLLDKFFLNGLQLCMQALLCLLSTICCSCQPRHLFLQLLASCDRLCRLTCLLGSLRL
mmetsp:Transcript_74427/g.164391  ORF Transcript_74427/g.164391 Transcript_74427/m.164391 type:complete len:204 (-) Transcript_74427:871-1482(-)